MGDADPTPYRLIEHMPLLTDRLRLRPIVSADLAALDALVSELNGDGLLPPGWDWGSGETWLRRAHELYRSAGIGKIAITAREDAPAGLEPNVLIGTCGFIPRSSNQGTELELVYHLRRSVRGSCVATEAARACASLALGALKEACVIAYILPNNVPSQAVARRLGMRIRGSIIHSELEHDVWELRAGAGGGT